LHELKQVIRERKVEIALEEDLSEEAKDVEITLGLNFVTGTRYNCFRHCMVSLLHGRQS
jgi:hypothetical protein